MTLYEAMKAADIETDHHESDLYVPASDAARKVLEDFPEQKAQSSTFVDDLTKRLWIDIPFAYDPFWKETGVPAHRTGEAS